jgi:dTDP-4-amino-4,6-dideoxygalactose transaminase
MDPELLETALRDAVNAGRPPKAVIVVDLYGQSADYDRIVPLCESYGVPLIEDAAEALGATCRGRACGSFGAMGILSFNGNKIITTSGGGMLLSDKKECIDNARLLATQARDPVPYYQHSRIGYNYRLSNLLAAVGRGQLETLDEKVTRRRTINRLYKNALDDLPGLQFMPEASYGKPNCWLTCITVDTEVFGSNNEGMRIFLESHDIESRYVWKPMHMQPVFRNCRHYGGRVSEDLFSRGLCLPSGSGLRDTDVERICDLIRSYHRSLR